MTLKDLDSSHSIGLVDCGAGVSRGSAFIVSHNGIEYIVTDCHVLYKIQKDRSIVPHDNYVNITFHGQHTYPSSALTASFELSKVKKKVSADLDLAVIAIDDAVTFENEGSCPLNPIPVDSDSLELWGKRTYMLGFPTSLFPAKPFTFKPFLATGIVSSVDDVESLFVVDVPSFYGNSGSPVFLDKGDGDVVLCGIVQRLITFNLKWGNPYESTISRIDWHNSGYTICRSVNSIKALIENENSFKSESES